MKNLSEIAVTVVAFICLSTTLTLVGASNMNAVEYYSTIGFNVTAENHFNLAVACFIIAGIFALIVIHLALEAFGIYKAFVNRQEYDEYLQHQADMNLDSYRDEREW